MLVAPTGMGKTFTACEIIRSAVAKGRRVWFLAHLREILQDTSDRLTQLGMAHGHIRSGHRPDPTQQVQLVAVKTAARRQDLPRPDLVIIDECHLAVAATYRAVLAAAGDPLLLGLTGTPERLDGRGLGELFDRLVPTCSTSELICEGLLASCRVFAPPGADLSQLRTRAGEFDQGQAGEILSRPTVVGCALEHWLRLCQGRRGVAFCSTVRHAETVAEQWRAAGLRAMAVSGGSGDDDRRAAVELLRAGELDLVACAQLWVAGVDVPSLDAVIWLRPTQSVTVWLQGCGRGLRTAPGKADCLILDHVGNALRHGLPQDPREWSLEGRRKRPRQGEAAVGVRQCESCFCCYPPQLPQCPECGAEPVVKVRKLVIVDGKLQEIADCGALQRSFEVGDLVKHKKSKKIYKIIDIAGNVYDLAQGEHILAPGKYWRCTNEGLGTGPCFTFTISEDKLSPLLKADPAYEELRSYIEEKKRSDEQMYQSLLRCREAEEEKRRARRREQGQAGTYHELVLIGKSRGMRNPWGWAERVMAGRAGKA